MSLIAWSVPLYVDTLYLHISENLLNYLSQWVQKQTRKSLDRGVHAELIYYLLKAYYRKTIFR